MPVKHHTAHLNQINIFGIGGGTAGTTLQLAVNRRKSEPYGVIYNRRRLMLPVTALLFENPSFTMMLTFLVVVDGSPATL